MVCSKKDNSYLPFYFVKGSCWYHPVGRLEGRATGYGRGLFKLGGPKCLIKW